MSTDPVQGYPEELLPEEPEDFTWPFGSTHKEVHDRVWRDLAALERGEKAPFDSIRVLNALEIRGGEPTLILSPEEQSGAYSVLSITRRGTGSLNLELTEYSADHSHTTVTQLLQVNLASRTVHVGSFVVPLDASAVPVVSGVLDDPAGPPASAAALKQVLAVLAAAGLVKDATTLAPEPEP
jgi:hypothetical protein